MSVNHDPYPQEPPMFSEVDDGAASIYVDNAIERGRIRVGRCGTIIMSAFKLLVEKHGDEYNKIVHDILVDEVAYFNRHIPVDTRTMGERLTDVGV